jgi:NAD(P)-dependent dehydrogenase (short-subunit alcohol dehydrogenase family)
MWTNAIAPIRAGRVLLPLVKDGGTMAFMTSVLGSVSLRQTGFAELYSASKSALNSMVKTFANVDAKGRVAVLALHPGWVRTEMGTEHAELDVETSVCGMADVLGTAQPLECRYMTYAGETLPW